MDDNTHWFDALAAYEKGTFKYEDKTLGEIASHLAGVAGWSVTGEIHDLTERLNFQGQPANLLYLLESVARVAGLQMRRGADLDTLEIGRFDAATGWPRPLPPKIFRIDPEDL